MEALSPLSRRLIAVALLALAIISSLNLVIVPLIAWAGETVEALDAARERRTRLTHIVEAQPPAQGMPIPDRTLLIAPDRDGAANILGSIISAAAAAQEVKIDQSGPASVSGNPSSLAVDINASGTELAIVQFAAALERSSPALRFQRWTITAPDAPDAPARLQAQIGAVWSPRP